MLQLYWMLLYNIYESMKLKLFFHKIFQTNCTYPPLVASRYQRKSSRKFSKSVFWWHSTHTQTLTNLVSWFWITFDWHCQLEENLHWEKKTLIGVCHLFFFFWFGVCDLFLLQCDMLTSSGKIYFLRQTVHVRLIPKLVLVSYRWDLNMGHRATI